MNGKVNVKMVVIDADYIYNRKNEPVIRLFGKDINDCMDVCLHVSGFDPYIYVGFDNETMRWNNIFEMKKDLESVLKGYLKYILIVKRYLPIGYQTQKTDVLKLVLFNPKTVRDVRKILEDYDIDVDNIYDADILFKDRFLADKKIYGMSVISAYCNEVKNYGIGVDKTYICGVNDVVPVESNIMFEY